MPQKQKTVPTKNKKTEQAESVAVPYEEILAGIKLHKGPVTTPQFAKQFGLTRSTAGMRLKDLILRKDVVRIRQGVYARADLPEAAYAADKDEAAMRERLADMVWPMSREEVMAEMRVGMTAQKDWFANLVSDGVVLRIAWVYWWAWTTPEQVDMSVPRKPLPQGWMLGRVGAHFTNQGFMNATGDQGGNKPLKVTRVLTQLKAQGLIRPVCEPGANGKPVKVSGAWERDAPILPPRFTLIAFSAKYGLDPRDAMPILRALEETGALRRAADHSPAGWQYEFTPTETLSKPRTKRMLSRVKQETVDGEYAASVWSKIQDRQAAHGSEIKARSSA